MAFLLIVAVVPLHLCEKLLPDPAMSTLQRACASGLTRLAPIPREVKPVKEDRAR
jgi:hypothetical protein